eukprot:87276_1
MALALSMNIDIQDDDVALLHQAITMSMQPDDDNYPMNAQVTEQKQQRLQNEKQKQVILRCLITIRSGDRLKDIKTIKKIMERIISDPSNTKYGNINVDKLSSKLSNYNSWFALLTYVGFRTSKQGDRLVFNCNMINTLTVYHQVLKNYDFGYVPETPSRNTVRRMHVTNECFYAAILFLVNNENFSSATSLQCICKTPLQTVDNSHTLYEGCGGTCNICLVFGLRNQTYYHCADYKNNKHPYGFDICESCVAMLFESTVKCSGSVINCPFVFQLLAVMKIYSPYIDDNIDIQYVIHNFLHILEKHDDDRSYNQIDVVFSVLVGNKSDECKLSQCPHFSSIYGEDSGTRAPRQQIWDKIHCYFYHGFDIGLRVHTREMLQFQGKRDYASKTIQITAGVLQKELCTLFRKKRNLYRKTINQFKTRLCNRFNRYQLQQEESESKQQHDDNISNMPTFHFGYIFEYENEPKPEGDILLKRIQVYPHYSSLKDELINNENAPLNVEQYNNEYKKGMIHLNSAYCQQYYSQAFPMG